jgi:hypothetical protein
MKELEKERSLFSDTDAVLKNRREKLMKRKHPVMQKQCSSSSSDEEQHQVKKVAKDSSTTEINLCTIGIFSLFLL